MESPSREGNSRKKEVAKDTPTDGNDTRVSPSQPRGNDDAQGKLAPAVAQPVSLSQRRSYFDDLHPDGVSSSERKEGTRDDEALVDSVVPPDKKTQSLLGPPGRGMHEGRKRSSLLSLEERKEKDVDDGKTSTQSGIRPPTSGELPKDLGNDNNDERLSSLLAAKLKEEEPSATSLAGSAGRSQMSESRLVAKVEQQMGADSADAHGEKLSAPPPSKETSLDVKGSRFGYKHAVPAIVLEDGSRLGVSGLQAAGMSYSPNGGRSRPRSLWNTRPSEACGTMSSTKRTKRSLWNTPPSEDKTLGPTQYTRRSLWNTPPSVGNVTLSSPAQQTRRRSLWSAPPTSNGPAANRRYSAPDQQQTRRSDSSPQAVKRSLWNSPHSRSPATLPQQDGSRPSQREESSDGAVSSTPATGGAESSDGAVSSTLGTGREESSDGAVSSTPGRGITRWALVWNVWIPVIWMYVTSVLYRIVRIPSTLLSKLTRRTPGLSKFVMALLLCLGLVAVFMTLNALCAEQCLSNDSNPYVYYSSKTSYNYVNHDDTTEMIYPGCDAVQIWLFSRHGTRYPSDDKIKRMAKILPSLKEEILRNYVEGKGQMCVEDIRLLREWRFGLNESLGDLLSPAGEHEQVQLAKRFQKRFPTLLRHTYSPQKFKFRFTHTQRAENSARAFGMGLFGPDIDIQSTGEHRDDLLRFYRSCRRWTKQVDKNCSARIEQDLFQKGHEVSQVILNVSKRMGFKRTLSFDDIQIFYDACRAEKSLQPSAISVWCSAFTKEELEVLEYHQDLDYYWTDSYGHSINYEQACPLVKDFIDSFKSAQELPKTQPYGVFSFGHLGGLLKVLTRLGLFNDSFPLLHSNYGVTRQFRVSLAAPFSGNLALVLFNCHKSGYRVVTFVQERVQRMRGCKSDLCPFSDVVAEYEGIANNCSLAEICNSASSVSGGGIVAMTTLVVAIIVWRTLSGLRSQN